MNNFFKKNIGLMIVLGGLIGVVVWGYLEQGVFGDFPLYHDSQSAEQLKGNVMVKQVKLSAKNEVSSDLALVYQLQNRFNKIAEESTKAVVSLQVTTEMKMNDSSVEQNELLRRFFGLPKDYGKTRREKVFGSGFIINEEGYLLSNYHVVKDAVEIKIIFKSSNQEYTAKVVGFDPDTDIALLKIVEKGAFPFLSLGNSDEVKVGDIAVAIGNPFGLSETFTTGVVSAKGRTGIVGNAYENFIQTDVAINQGNSGGPLINIEGSVIGINSAIFSKGGGSIGISFSIPINMAKDVVEQLKTKGRVERGWIGVAFGEMTAELSKALGVPNMGVVINQVIEDSPASKADIKPGDVLISYNGEKIKSGRDLVRKVGKTAVGKKVKVIVLRNNKEVSSYVVIEKKMSAGGEDNGVSPSVELNKESKEFFGIKVRPLNKEQKKLFKNNSPTGVWVSGLNRNSQYAEVGGTLGDIILSINKKPVNSIKRFEKIMSNLKAGQTVLFTVKKKAGVHYLVVHL